MTGVESCSSDTNPLREVIAGIVDPTAKFQNLEGVQWSRFELERRELAYRKADSILGILPAAQAGQDERRQARLERSGLDIPEAQTLDDVVAQPQPDRDAIYRAIESNVRSEPDKHFINRRWMVGINDAVDAILALPSPPAALPAGETPLAWLAEHKNCELSFSGWDEDSAWLLHSVNGGRNDREWTLLATGDTPEAALRKAMGRAMSSTDHEGGK